MRKITTLNEKILNEDASNTMIKALQDLEGAWNYVAKLWYDNEVIEDAMLKAATVCPFADPIEDINISKWIKTCIKALKNK